jgi:hypothetical protein
MNPPDFFKDNKQPMLRGVLMTLVALAMLLLKFQYHELWKDEWQAWLMARDMGWGELLGSLYYEGHPALWYLYLKVWTLISSGTGMSEALAMSLGHSALVLGFLYVLFFRTSFSVWSVLAISLGYYFFFEYGVVNRGYVLVMILAIWSARLMKAPQQNPWLLALSLFLLCQTEVYGVLMAGGLLLYGLLGSRGLSALRERWYQIGLGGLLLGLLVFVLSVYPRADQDELSRAYLSEPFSTDVIGKAFQGGGVNTFWIGSIPDTNVFGVTGLGIVLSVLVFASIVWLFRRERRILFTFLGFELVFFFFLIAIYTGGVRQWGMAYVFFIVLLQLWSYEKPRLGWDQLAILALIFGFQIYYSGLAVTKEIRHPFTYAKAAGEFIRDKVPKEVPIVAINKFEAAPVTGYAGRKFYALPDGEPFSYFKWVEKVYLPPEAELRLFGQFKRVGGLIIISPKPLGKERYPNAQLWREFTGFTLKNEQYYLYTLEVPRAE